MSPKKRMVPLIPYFIIGLYSTKFSQGWRYAYGADISEHLRNIGAGFERAFSYPFPSFHPYDLLFGLLFASGLWVAVYVKSKREKKFRRGVEYGSARWGTPADIAPYIDPKFRNNVILTQTERLTMNSRPKDPKTARNKNVLVIGGSGSGKTRFFIKPNLMQMHSSYVVTDPKGYTNGGQRKDHAFQRDIFCVLH